MNKLLRMWLTFISLLIMTFSSYFAWQSLTVINTGLAAVIFGANLFVTFSLLVNFVFIGSSYD